MGEILLPLIDLPTRDAGAPLPALYADDDQLILAYRPGRGDGSVIVEFGGVFAHLFGLPNDEAFSGHRYARRWPKSGEFACEVLRSQWIADLCKRNRVHRNHSDRLFDGLRHLVLAFKDATLEVAGRTYAWTRDVGHPQDCVVRRLAQRK